MNHLKVYFLAYFMQNSQKLNMVGYTASNMWPKRYGGPCRLQLQKYFTDTLLINGIVSSKVYRIEQ